jgi:hypothetical protein
MNELIIRLTGAVTESNFDQWKEQALEQIRATNRELVTDDDFSWAEETIKACKNNEHAIKKAKEEALNQTADINKLFAAMDQISTELSNTRLSLEKQVKTEKERRKADIIAEAIATVRSEIEIAVAGNIFVPGDIAINDTVIKAATAGKKTIEGMRKAVNVVMAAEIKRHLEAIEAAILNVNAIEWVEKEFPGLFPDKKALAWKTHDEVNATIDARVARYRLQMKEKEEREAAQANIQPGPEPPPTPAAPLAQPPTASPSATLLPDQGESREAVDDFIFTVHLRCGVTQAKALAQEISEAFGSSDAVISFNLKRA